MGWHVFKESEIYLQNKFAKDFKEALTSTKDKNDIKTKRKFLILFLYYLLLHEI